MVVRFTIGDELRSRFGIRPMKPYISDWPVMLDGLRRMWEIGEETILETAFYEPLKR
jgi:hypothetical protein